MANQVVIIHGWSDTSKSFTELTAFLRANGFQPFPIWLGDYISLDDDVRIQDVAKRMQAVVLDAIATKGLKAPFDIIIHSTGGLVVREWIASYYPGAVGCPAKRVVMLAPANFGSKLAHTGKSFLGRIIKGWNNWFQTGEEMLRSLELASAYQWDLARRDLFGDGPGPYGPGKVLPFVITGTRGFPSGVNQIANESGADGTVRGCAANLNAEGVTIDFSADPNVNPIPVGWKKRAGDLRFPFALLPDRNHGSITRPRDDVGVIPATQAVLGRLILQALACADTLPAYSAIADEWSRITEATGELSKSEAEIKKIFLKNAPEPADLRRYLQVNVFVRDNHHFPVNDYILEFYSSDVGGNADMVKFHKDVLKHVHTNTIEKVRRCFYIDHTELLKEFYTAKRKTVVMSISAEHPGKNVRYFDNKKRTADGFVEIHKEDPNDRENLGPQRLRRHVTHLYEIVIPRVPTDDVFKLKLAP